MRIRNLLLMASAIGPIMSGCARDPLVYGPYLIGAERPVIRDGVCCPLGDMRSQDVRGDWRPCEYEKTYCHKAVVDPDTTAAQGAYVEDLKAPPYKRSPATKPAADARSAW